MSDEQVEETPKPAGVEFDYGMNDEGDVETAVIVRDPAKMRRVVTATMQWIPAVIGEPDDDGNTVPYPGMEELERISQEDPDRLFHMPIMIIAHCPGHKPVEEGADDIQHQLYLLDADTVINLVGTGVNMLTENHEKTDLVMHFIHHVVSETDCTEDEDDDN